MKIPPPQLATTVLHRVIRADAGQVSLDGHALGFFVEVDGQKTVAEIAGKCGLTQADTLEITARLLDLKLVEPIQPAGDLVDQEFMEFLQRQLSKAIGPIAGVIIEDTLADMGCRGNAVPVHQAPELVELLAREIQRDEQRIDFQQSMVNIIMQKGYSA